jgi:hypothetical protein
MKIKYFLFLTLISMLVACATPANKQAMTVSKFEGGVIVNPSLKGKFYVRNVNGGKDTNPLWTSQVGTADFKSALEQSLDEVGYKADKETNATYFIDAELKELDQPLFGLTFDVHSNVFYVIDGNGTKKSIPIAATGQAKVNDAFIAIERLRIANEKSIRENIKAFINSLDQSIK